jgi:hypothetical protein
MCDTKCLIQYVALPHCGDNSMAFSAELLCHDVISLESGEKHINVGNVKT